MKILKFHELNELNELKNEETPAETFNPESMDGITSVGPLHDEEDTIKYFKQNDNVEKDKISDKN